MADPVPDPEKRFTGRFIFEYLDGKEWRVPEDISYRTVAGPVSTVRAGYVFDFASIPRMFWRLAPPTGTEDNRYGVAALFHDWLYDHGRVEGRRVTREYVDRLFLEIMRYVKVSGWMATLMYRAVRIGGWLGWRRCRKKEQRQTTAELARVFAEMDCTTGEETDAGVLSP